MSELGDVGGVAIANAPPEKPKVVSNVLQEPDVRPTPHAPLPKGSEPCIGLPVQYGHNDEVVPGILQRQARTSNFWDVRIYPNGAFHSIVRSAVPFSPTPKAGYWSFLPGWKYKPE